MPSPEDYSRAEVDRELESLEDLNDYRPLPPKRTFTVRVRYQFKGRGKPREYPLDDDDSPLTISRGDCLMPELSRFLGIIITMYYNDHPPPHFHVRYNQQKALVDIESLSVIEGKLSPRILGIVIEWAAIHKTELLENWQLARLNTPLNPIAPLE